MRGPLDPTPERGLVHTLSRDAVHRRDYAQSVWVVCSYFSQSKDAVVIVEEPTTCLRCLSMEQFEINGGYEIFARGRFK